MYSIETTFYSDHRSLVIVLRVLFIGSISFVVVSSFGKMSYLNALIYQLKYKADILLLRSDDCCRDSDTEFYSSSSPLVCSFPLPSSQLTCLR